MAKQSKENIFQRLIISYCILIILFILFGLLSLSDMRTASKLTRTIYDHPFIVSTASLRSDVSIAKIHRSMKDIVLFNFSSKINASIEAVKEEEQQVFKYLDIVKNRILGDEGKILEEEARQLFSDWKPIRKEVIELVRKGQREKAAKITMGKGADHVIKLESKILALTDYARNKASVFMQNAEKVHSRMHTTLIAFLIIGVILSSLVAFFTIKQIIAVERSIKESEALLDETQQLTKVGGWKWEIKKQTMFWTNEVYRIHDFQPSEFPQDSKEHIERSLECYDPEDRPVLMAAFRECAEKGQAYDFEFPFTTALGRRIWIRTVAEPVQDGDKIVRVVGNIMDITKRKRAEERNERLSHILDESLNEIYIFDAKTLRFLEVNLGARRNLGYSIEEVTTLTPLDLNPEFTPEAFAELIQPLHNGEKDKVRFETIQRRKDGSLYPVEVHLQLVDGDVTAFVAIIIDITDRKRAEEVLRKSEEKYRSILESMKDAVYICSSDLRIEYMNPRMISRVGRDATSVLCHKVIYDSDEKCSWCVFDQIQKGEHVEFELADPKDNRYYFITNSPISHSDGSISKLTIFRDITETKAIESQLRQARKMESIGTLTGGIAHDFNNILYMITGNAELALEDIPEWNPTHANLEEIKAAGFRAAGIVKQLLNFSRKTDQESKPIGAITVIKDALKFLRSTIPTTIEIHKHLPETDVTILADPIQINQILMNLCTNASQAMEKTGGILEITVEKETLTEDTAVSYHDLTSGDYLKIAVRDTGPGIDPEIIDRIFDPYFSTKEVGKGSGMGLAVVLGIVKNHNGSITVDSQPGKDTTFTILFPVVSEKPVMEVKTSDEIPRGNETILFVDDEESIANMTHQMLERLGYKVETKLNPVEALELFKSKPDHFGLVITDMTMPQMTGVKLSEKLKAVRSDIPVIICTGHSSLVDEEKAKKLGIAAYIMKPIVMSDIAKIIRKVLAYKERSGQG
jgi:PAS domain S-box-containing protein